MKVIRLKLENNLHSAFKSNVAKHETNMQETLVRLLTEYLKNSEKIID